MSQSIKGHSHTLAVMIVVLIVVTEAAVIRLTERWRLACGQENMWHM